MIFKRLRAGITVDDKEFDAMYPEPLKAISEFHFTPVQVAKKAAQYLVKQPGTTVLDIGSGAGKFCMVGAASTEGYFTGVEQRKSLHVLAKQLSERHELSNINYICLNITALEFRQFEAVYFFNSFFENMSPCCAIDNSIRLDKQLYQIYSSYVKTQLRSMPAGTRLATYFSYSSEIPDSYKIQSTAFDGKLKLWEKVV